MSTLDEQLAQLTQDMDTFHQLTHGDASVVVQLASGPVPSLARLTKQIYDAAVNGFVTTSSSTADASTGSKTFTVEAGKNFQPYQNVTASADGVSLSGTIVSYIGTSLTLNINSVEGTGSKSNWSIVAGNNQINNQGAPGKDSYQLAVDNGFVGTEAEWLVSLKGSNGKSAYQTAVDGGYSGTEAEFIASLQATGSGNRAEITVTLDVNNEVILHQADSNNFYLLLDKSGKLTSLTGFSPGDEVTLVVKQDAVGGNTLAFGNSLIFNKPSPAVSAGADTYTVVTMRLCTAGYWLTDLAAGYSTTAGSAPVDTDAPTVSIASTVSNVTALGSTILTATATDNVGVAKVDFYRNGGLIGTSTAAPYSITESYTSNDNGTINYFAKAYDGAGNAGSSATISVVVNIPPPPVAIPSSIMVDSATSSEIQTAISLADIGSKRLAAAEAIVTAMKPAHRLYIYREDVLVISAQYTADCVVTEENNVVYISLGAMDSAGDIVTADLNTGNWTFEVSGGTGNTRKITGDVGKVGSGKSMILSASPVAGMGFDGNVKFSVQPTID